MRNQSKLPNPFLAARREAGIHVALQPDDVRVLRPQLTAEQAQGFLDRHAPAIAHVMLMAGAQMLKVLLENENHEC